ncbi:hypothetical protein O3P69_008306 [Scylla paramamosain]|uniref:Uncharacterized protein n=1 Tax=Scylla paramamosain TaxID=85552 RepID=A0AAW0SKB0_SCYPA
MMEELQVWVWRLVVVVVVMAVIPGHSMTPDEETRVFGLQTDVWAAPSSEVFLRYTLSGTRPPPTALTICYRYLLHQYRDGVYFFSYATSDRMDNAVLLCECWERRGRAALVCALGVVGRVGLWV